MRRDVDVTGDTQGMWKTVAGVVVALALVAGATLYLNRSGPAIITGQLSAVAAASGGDDPRWQRVTGPRTFEFPDDHGQHPAYQTEWWYYTGNLQADDGQQFGFQLTFFRRGLDPEPTPRASRWAARNIYLAHFTVSDLPRGRFYAAERFSRDGADLAGASGTPYRVWLGPWEATGTGPEGMTMQLRAATDEVAIDLQLKSAKPPTLQGDRGYSIKGQGVGNASYYYSLTRMTTTGTLTITGTPHRIVSGSSWMDHEWGTSRLESGSTGWDWFALQLSDGREVTWAQIRQVDVSLTPPSFGSITAADGSTTRLSSADATLEVTGHWTSPRSGAQYPAGWRLRIPAADLDLRITPRIPDQELPVSIIYWEGAVTVAGQGSTSGGSPITGVGYVELTGYAASSGTRPGR